MLFQHDASPPVGHMATPDHQTPPDSDLESDASSSFFFFNKSYVPLSSFPTPPPSSSHSRNSSNQLACAFPPSVLHSSLLGPSIHLCNLIPSAASLLDPSHHLVNSLLVRADLPAETLALACCILDSLNSRFALSWRRSLPLGVQAQQLWSDAVESNGGVGHMLTAPPSPAASASSACAVSIPPPHLQHIDSVRPELIILAALIISHKFLDDQTASTGYYASEWARSRWTCAMINATELCIMANLNYRILPLLSDECLADAKDDMQRAGWSVKRDSGIDVFGDHAVWGEHGQITPALTPMAEEYVDVLQAGLQSG